MPSKIQGTRLPTSERAHFDQLAQQAGYSDTSSCLRDLVLFLNSQGSLPGGLRASGCAPEASETDESAGVREDPQPRLFEASGSGNEDAQEHTSWAPEPGGRCPDGVPDAPSEERSSSRNRDCDRLRRRVQDLRRELTEVHGQLRALPHEKGDEAADLYTRIDVLLAATNEHLCATADGTEALGSTRPVTRTDG